MTWQLLARIGARSSLLLCCLWALAACSPETAGPSRDSRRTAILPVAGTGPAAVSGSSVPTGPLTPTTPATTSVNSAGRGAAGPVSTGFPVAGSPASAPAQPPIPDSAHLPCAVSQALVTACQSCHGSTPIGGAPMPLVTYADLHKPAVTNPTLKVYELAKMRLDDAMRPMPPGGTIAAADKATLGTWLGAGAAAGTEATCAIATPPPTGGTVAGDGTYGALTQEPGETCYDFKTHNSTTSVDATPYAVSLGEHYEQFYFKAPWTTGTVATRYGTKLDNEKVLHHWLLFSTTEADPEGAHKTAPLPTLIGVNAQLLAGWAVGGTNLAMPPDVGFELPAKGSELNIQWHFYNSTGAPATDASSVQICTVPAGTRPHVATITWLGQENLGGNKWLGGAGMPPHSVSNFSGTCTPRRKGMNATDPIHLLYFWPHMHTFGTNMKTVVNHKSGMAETIFDKAFDFNHQVHYPANYDLMPGDTLTATCTFNNTSDLGVPFGESTGNEMCYQFTYAWPAHALENNASSLIGATNTCW